MSCPGETLDAEAVIGNRWVFINDDLEALTRVPLRLGTGRYGQPRQEMPDWVAIRIAQALWDGDWETTS